MTKEMRLYNGGNVISSTKAAGKTGQLHVKKMKLEHYLTPYQKKKKKPSKWTKDLMQDRMLKNSYRGKLGHKLQQYLFQAVS